MSLHNQRTRLARLEARRRRRETDENAISDFEIARRVAFLLRCAVEGIGPPGTLATATRVSCLLQKVPMLTPEQIEEARIEREKSKLKHAV